MRTGIGYDVHPFAPKRKLILGGVEIPYNRGLSGHSDADVLVHSIADALLGAMGERDLGYHFPETDPQYKNICSLYLLERIYNMLRQKNFRIINVDSSILAQEPYLSPYISKMKTNIAQVLKIEINRVGVKVVSPERLGFLGRKEGIACLSIATIENLS